MDPDKGQMAHPQQARATHCLSGAPLSCCRPCAARSAAPGAGMPQQALPQVPVLAASALIGQLLLWQSWSALLAIKGISAVTELAVGIMLRLITMFSQVTSLKELQSLSDSKSCSKQRHALPEVSAYTCTKKGARQPAAGAMMPPKMYPAAVPNGLNCKHRGYSLSSGTLVKGAAMRRLLHNAHSRTASGSCHKVSWRWHSAIWQTAQAPQQCRLKA